MTEEFKTKPLGGKAYGSIPHLPGSRIGPGDHHCHEGQAEICTVKTRDRHDKVIVQEKLDGSCVSIAKIDGQIVALTRAGYRAHTSPYEQHQLFEAWVYNFAYKRADDLLADGERLCGEWLAQAHSTRYELQHEPFVAFDLIRGDERAPYDEFEMRVWKPGLFTIPHTLWYGILSIPIGDALGVLGTFGHHGATDPVEGCVWRVERRGKVDFLAKYVRPDKVDGIYLENVSGQPAVWNWRP